MTYAPPASDSPLAQARRIDRFCDDFEAAWAAGQRPRLEAFLERIGDSGRPQLLRELLAIEIHYRRRLGESPTAREFSERFAQWMTAELHEAVDDSLAAPSEKSPSLLAEKNEETSIVLPTQVPPKSSRYSIVKMHAKGGMGEVWLADDLEIGRRVAYKRVRAGGEQIQQRFFAEAQITGQLEHPGIVPVHELGRDEQGKPFYVMRLVQGRTLKHAIADAHAEMTRDPKSRELCWLKLLEMFLTLCRTVAYAHHRGVIHRDIKPDNIMIGAFGETLVVDWGLAKVLDSPDLSASRCVSVLRPQGPDSTATQDGNVLGSPQYMSPEMAEGRIAEEDVRTDIYLLGATLYQLLTNRPPRQGSSREEILNLAKTAKPAPPRSVNPNVPKALEAICIKAMAHGKQERYESAQAVANEIEQFLAGEPVLAHRESWTDKLGRWLRRHRQRLVRMSLAALLLVTTVGALLGWWTAQRALSRSNLVAQATADKQEFRRLAEQLHYALADTTPLDQRLSLVDPQAAGKLWTDIQRITERWQPGFANFPLEGDRENLRRELVELTLWRVQQEIAGPVDTSRAKQLSLDLDGILPFATPSVSLHALRARCYVLAGESTLASQALAPSKLIKPVAFDHFLAGEWLRAASLNPTGDDGSSQSTDTRPDRDALLKAIAEYQRCVELESDHFWAHLQKGRCYLLCDEPELALVELNAAVAVRRQSPWAWTILGFAQSIAPLSNPKAAKDNFDTALRLDPDFAQAQLYRGLLRLQQKQPDQAKSDLSMVSRAHPENLQARYFLALAEHDTANFAAALKLCDEILGPRPDLRAPRLLRVQVALALGNGEQARTDLNLWLSLFDKKLDPASPRSAAVRCKLWRRLGERSPTSVRKLAWQLALADGRAAIAGGFKSASTHGDLAAILYRHEKLDEAIEQFGLGLACQATPAELAVLHLNRGGALVARQDALIKLKRLGRQDFALAKEDFEIAAQLSGDDIKSQAIRAEAHAMLGYIAARQSAPEEAYRQSALAVAQIRSTSHWTIWSNLACVYNAVADGNSAGDRAMQDAAMMMLANAMSQATRAGRADVAATTILADDALKSLQPRADFQKLIQTPRP